MKITLAVCTCLGIALVATGGAEIPPRPVDLSGTKSLDEALKAIGAQTGNRIVDQRGRRQASRLNLDLSGATFWQALDRVARQANVSFSPYRVEGAVAITDGPHRAVPVSYDGLFRTAVKSLTIQHDLESKTRTCTTHLEVAWEPRFQPFYMNVGTATLTYGADANGKKAKAQIPGSGTQMVAQRGAIEFALQAAAPPRAVREIEALQGQLTFIGPSKMLAFKFNGLKAMKNAPGFAQKQEDVNVLVSQIAVAGDRWSFDIVIQNPPGGPEFESFQHWLHNNQIYLEKTTAAGTEILRPNLADEQQLDLITAERAAIRYHFHHRGRPADKVGQLADWTLVYHTPAKIIEVPMAFEFKQVPLP